MDASTCIRFPSKHNKIVVTSVNCSQFSNYLIACFISLEVHEMRMEVKQNYTYLAIEPHKAVLSEKKLELRDGKTGPLYPTF